MLTTKTNQAKKSLLQFKLHILHAPSLAPQLTSLKPSFVSRCTKEASCGNISTLHCHISKTIHSNKRSTDICGTLQEGMRSAYIATKCSHCLHEQAKSSGSSASYNATFSGAVREAEAGIGNTARSLLSTMRAVSAETELDTLLSCSN